MDKDAKDSWEPPDAGRGRKDPPLEPSEGDSPCRHLDFRLRASGTVREYISVGLWYFVTGTTGHQCTLGSDCHLP